MPKEYHGNIPSASPKPYEGPPFCVPEWCYRVYDADPKRREEARRSISESNRRAWARRKGEA